jgi:hypothetical protein
MPPSSKSGKYDRNARPIGLLFVVSSVVGLAGTLVPALGAVLTLVATPLFVPWPADRSGRAVGVS